MVRAIGNNPGSKPGRDFVFTLGQATATLPLVSRIAADLVTLHQSIQTQRAQIREIDRMTGTIQVADYRDELGDIRASLAVDELDIQRCLAELASLGVLPHDPIDGGVDFPGTHNRRSVRFCWALGDQAVKYWHETDESCERRQAIELC